MLKMERSIQLLIVVQDGTVLNISFFISITGLKTHSISPNQARVATCANSSTKHMIVEHL
jgi:hypothetical protein